MAYYSCGADSRSLFEGLEVCDSLDFEQRLNAYNVVHLDMASFRDKADAMHELQRTEHCCKIAMTPKMGEDCGPETQRRLGHGARIGQAEWHADG